MRIPLLSAVLLSTGVLVACGGGDPTISISASPTTLASGQTTTLTVSVENFELRDPGSHQHGLTTAQTHDHGDDHGDDHAHGDDAEDYLPDAGHYHVYLDSTEVNPMMMAWRETVELTVTASAGPHRLIVRLNGDDHRFLRPEVKAHIDITVQ